MSKRKELTHSEFASLGGNAAKKIPGQLEKIAKAGGSVTKQKYGSEHYRRIQKLSAEARRRKKLLKIDSLTAD